MPDNAQAPGQDAGSEGTTDKSAAAPDNVALTRADLEEMLKKTVEPLQKTLENQRSLHDRQLNALRTQVNQRLSQATMTDYGDTTQAQDVSGYNPGTPRDQEIATIIARNRYGDYDDAEVMKRLNDPAVAPQYLALEADGRTFDWPTIKMNAWRDIRAERADAILAKQREAESQSDEQRDKLKRQAMISGSSAAGGEESPIPSTKQELRKLSDKELEDLVKQDADPLDPPSFMKR